MRRWHAAASLGALQQVIDRLQSYHTGAMVCRCSSGAIQHPPTCGGGVGGVDGAAPIGGVPRSRWRIHICGLRECAMRLGAREERVENQGDAILAKLPGTASFSLLRRFEYYR